MCLRDFLIAHTQTHTHIEQQCQNVLKAKTIEEFQMTQKIPMVYICNVQYNVEAQRDNVSTYNKNKIFYHIVGFLQRHFCVIFIYILRSDDMLRDDQPFCV